MALDERTAINLMQRGDIRGLDALMLAYQLRAIRAAYLVTHDLALAEDIVQSAFIRAYERIGQYDPERPFGPWFLRSVVNSAATAARRHGRFVPLQHARPGHDAVAGSDDLPDLDFGPEERILGAETREAIWQAIDSLPPSQRAAIVLRYFLELPEAETAQRLGVPPGTVKSRLATARSRLRAVLGSHDDRRDDHMTVTSSSVVRRGALDEEAE